MKILMCIIVGGLINCTSTKKMPLDQPDISFKIEVNQHEVISLVFKNNTKSNLFLSDPACYINNDLNVFEGENEIVKKVLIKPDMHCASNLVKIDPGETSTFIYAYKLDFLFDLESCRNYMIKIKYKGHIEGENDKAYKSDFESRLALSK